YALLGGVYALGCSGNIDSEPTRPERDVEVPTPPPTQQTPAPGPTEEPVEEPPAKPLLQAQVEDILNRTCGECHGANGRREAGMNYIEDFDQLAQNGKIVPGDVDASPIMQRLVGGTMPPEGSGFPPPSEDEIAQIGQFIAQWDGPDASAGPRVCDNQSITFDEIYGAMLTDILLTDSDERDSIRYVGLTNRYNAGVCDDDLEVERWALSKLVNSLSTESRITEPEVVEGTRDLVYRIDLRRYGWDRGINGENDGWEAILAESPYAVPFVGDEADVLVDQMNTAVPYMYADALANVAAVGELYYALVDVPGDIGQLQANLRVDAQDNIDRGLVARAGTQNSGVSREDRLVERQESGVGAGSVLWQAFEFDSGAELFNEPLDFQAVGSEAIFSLPNGLHGYAIFDENGQTIEESDILFDTLQDNFPVTSAVSCMTCHSRGFLQVRDEVRTFVNSNRLDFNSDEVELVNEVYPGVDAMDDLISSDRRIYQQALQEAGVPIEVADPVSSVFFRFEENVRIADVAGDLGVSPEFLDNELNRLDVTLRVLRSDLPLRRRNFENVYAESLCVLNVASSNRPDEQFCNF
ncbi:MAG: c-type cytochrome domain-containing protein, partial [Polyangiaceae bacterium]